MLHAMPLPRRGGTLLPVLETGRPLDARSLRDAMTGTFGASDADGAWVWKDAYEAAEAALVLFIRRYGRAMRREAGTGPDGPAAMLRMLETLAGLEPSQTRRSEEQLRLQQFSTPLPLAYAALQAAAIRPGDVVLEPSAGTGMLAVMAHCALGNEAAGSLHLNEIAATRAALLAGLFPGSTVTRHNAEAIRDHLPELHPTVVLMNPPFSASPGVDRIRHDADLRHIRSAFSMLRGRKRALWLSQSDKLLEETRRDWTAIGGREDDVIPLGKVRQGADIPHAEGILFTTYATLRSPARQGKRSRLDQIVAWLAGGEDHDRRHAFAGVIVFDEAHAMANAAGSKGARGEVRPSQQGRAGLRLQNALPDARILYVSATGATTVPGLAYARRLGLWASTDRSGRFRSAFPGAIVTSRHRPPLRRRSRAAARCSRSAA